MNKPIKIYDPKEWLEEVLNQHPDLPGITGKGIGRFSIQKIENLVKLANPPFPPAKAKTHSIVYLTKGIYHLRVGLYQLEIHKHEFIVVPAGQVFTYERNDINTGYVCNFSNDFLIGKFINDDFLKEYELLKTYGNPIIKPDPAYIPHLNCTFERLFFEYSKNGLDNIDLLQAYLNSILSELNILYKPLLGRNYQSSVIVNRFKELVNQNIREKHLVSDYAAMLNISPQHLTRKIKAMTGLSASNWLDQTLLLEAKILLIHTRHSVGEIASQLGIFDQSYFSRLFKKYEGTTPLVFRKKAQKS